MRIVALARGRQTLFPFVPHSAVAARTKLVCRWWVVVRGCYFDDYYYGMYCRRSIYEYTRRRHDNGGSRAGSTVMLVATGVHAVVATVVHAVVATRGCSCTAN